jgi:hypothetical protein
MTVIVFDGSTCAVDSGAPSDTTMLRVRKFWTRADELITGAGNSPHVAALVEWYLAGAKVEDFPPMVRAMRDAELIVVDRQGVRRYEAAPYAVDHGMTMCAFGGGRDFAYGALACGAPATQAAQVACRYSPVCAEPVHTFYWHDDGELIKVGG